MKKIIYLVIVLFAFTSCKKFLEPNSPSEYTPQTAAALKELLMGDGYPRYNGADRLEAFIGLLEDDVVAAPFVDKPTTQINDALRACYGWKSDMFLVFRTSLITPRDYNIWQGIYSRIKGTNLVLDYIDQVQGTPSEINAVTAEAHALRAFYYFNLVNIFGKPYNFDKNALGVPLKLKGIVEGGNMKRNSVEEVYSQILTDLLSSEKEFLTLSKGDRWKSDYRISLPMVQLLLSRVYLYQENWSKSAEYAEKVMATPDFTLFDLNAVPAPTAEVPYYHFLNYAKNPELIWLYGRDDDAFMFTWAKSQGSDNSMPISAKRAMFRASDELLNLYHINDLRQNNYIMKDAYSSYKVAKGKVTVTNSNLVPLSTGFARGMRFSEAYLNAAEAYAKLDESGKALQLMNDLRTKRYKTNTYVKLTNLSGDALLAEIRDERRRELCFEGHRWFDLRRQGMPSFSRNWPINNVDVETFTIQKNDPAYTIPIPKEALDANPGLVQNEY